jgi:hypothetical protein
LKDTVTSFSEIRALPGQRVHPFVEIDFEMLGSHNLPVEISVMNFISAEIVELSGRGGTQENGEETVSQDDFHF